MITVAHLGARDHYGLARMLNMEEHLDRLYTDLWIPGTSRYSAVLPKARVCAFMATAMSWRLRKFTNNFERWLMTGSHFAAKVSRQENRRFRDDDAQKNRTIIGYTGGALEFLNTASARNQRTILCQVDPGIAWYKTLQDEARNWHGAENLDNLRHLGYEDRIRAEWQAADIVVVNSMHSKNSLISENVDPSKIVVIPLAKPSHSDPVKPRDLPSKPYKIIFVGNVGLAKGFPYFAQAAALAGPDFEFHAYGNNLLKPDFLKDQDWPVKFHGHIPQSEVLAAMDESAILVFPTLSDGFGQVQLEAMSRGLPVVATTACGEVVEDGVSGLLVPPRDPGAIAEAIKTICASRESYKQMSIAAISRADDFHPDKIARQWIEVLERKGLVQQR